MNFLIGLLLFLLVGAFFVFRKKDDSLETLPASAPVISTKVPSVGTVTAPILSKIDTEIKKVVDQVAGPLLAKVADPLISKLVSDITGSSNPLKGSGSVDLIEAGKGLFKDIFSKNAPELTGSLAALAAHTILPAAAPALVAPAAPILAAVAPEAATIAEVVAPEAVLGEVPLASASPSFGAALLEALPFFITVGAAAKIFSGFAEDFDPLQEQQHGVNITIGGGGNNPSGASSPDGYQDTTIPLPEIALAYS